MCKRREKRGRSVGSPDSAGALMREEFVASMTADNVVN